MVLICYMVDIMTMRISYGIYDIYIYICNYIYIAKQWINFGCD